MTSIVNVLLMQHFQIMARATAEAIRQVSEMQNSQKHILQRQRSLSLSHTRSCHSALTQAFAQASPGHCNEFHLFSEHNLMRRSLLLTFQIS